MDGEIRSDVPSVEPPTAAPAEGASREAFEALKAGSAPRRAGRQTPRWQGLAKIGLIVALAGGGTTWALTSSESPFVYSVMVSDVATQPAAYADRTLRMEGPLREGSIQFRQEPCEYRFVLAEGEGASERAVNVRFPQCIVPDTFRDGMGISVVVEGRLEADGTFLATQVIPRCPSRYEMDELQRSGEAAPHTIPSS